MAVSWPRPTDFVVGQPNHAPEHNRINEHLNALWEATGTLPEGMTYDPDTGELTMDVPDGRTAKISPQKIFMKTGSSNVDISSNEIRTQKSDGDLGSGVSLTPGAWSSYIVEAGTSSSFGLTLEAFYTLKDDVFVALMFPEGESYTTLPEEGTGSVPHTLATREWVASEGTLLESPNGSLFRLTVADDGTLTTTPVI